MPAKVIKLETRNARDPLNITGRLYNQVAELLKQLEEGEHITLKERVAALVAISRIQIVFLNLRKEKDDGADAGSTVRKYATAFTKDAVSRRKKTTRPAEPEPEPDDLGGLLDDGGSDDGDAD